MTVTLPVDDVGSDARVLLVPRQGSGFAKVGVVAEVSERVRLAGRGAAVSLLGLHRGVPGAAEADRDGVLRVAVDERPDEAPPPHLTRELEREYRAVVEEILELRGDDGRISAFVRSITDPGALADTAGYSPDLNVAQKLQLLETLDVVERLKLALQLQQERLAELRGPQAHPRRRRGRRAEAAARVLPAPADGRDPQGARRKRRLRVGGIPREDRRAGMPEAVRQQAERELSRLERMGDSNAESSMIRTYLDWLLAVPWSKRSEERLDPVHAREVLDADHEGLDDVKQRITEYLAVRKLRAERGMAGHAAVGRHPDADRPAGNRQDVDRRIDRAGDRPAVRPDVARRRARRGGDPRPSAHLHRRAARTAGARAARRRHDEPGDHARRGRQARRRLARRSVGGAARGARPGAEPRVPRSLPRRRARSVARAVHRDGQRGRHDSRPAARSHGSDPLRRLHDRREGGDRARPSLAAAGRAQRPARRRRDGRPTTVLRLVVTRLHARGRRPAARARARHAAAQDRDAHRVGDAAGADRRRRRGGARGAGPAEGLPRSGGPHGGARRRDRPRRHRRRRRRAVRRSGVDAGQGRAGADRSARRRHEGVGAHRADLRQEPRGASSASTSTRSTAGSSTCTCRPARSRRTDRARASRW